MQGKSGPFRPHGAYLHVGDGEVVWSLDLLVHGILRALAGGLNFGF
jgi:hypothetical protein